MYTNPSRFNFFTPPASPSPPSGRRVFRLDRGHLRHARLHITRSSTSRSASNGTHPRSTRHHHRHPQLACGERAVGHQLVGSFPVAHLRRGLQQDARAHGVERAVRDVRRVVGLKMEVQVSHSICLLLWSPT